MFHTLKYRDGRYTNNASFVNQNKKVLPIGEVGTSVLSRRGGTWPFPGGYPSPGQEVRGW